MRELNAFLCCVLCQDYKPEEDPALYHSAKTDRGPLGPEWKVPGLVPQSRKTLTLDIINCLISLSSQNELKTDCPYMCAYKLVTVKFRWWGLQTKVENFIHRVKHNIRLNDLHM